MIECGWAGRTTGATGVARVPVLVLGRFTLMGHCTEVQL